MVATSKDAKQPNEHCVARAGANLPKLMMRQFNCVLWSLKSGRWQEIDLHMRTGEHFGDQHCIGWEICQNQVTWLFIAFFSHWLLIEIQAFDSNTLTSPGWTEVKTKTETPQVKPAVWGENITGKEYFDGDTLMGIFYWNEKGWINFGHNRLSWLRIFVQNTNEWKKPTTVEQHIKYNI